MEKNMETIPTKMPKPIVEDMDAFVKQGLFSSRSEIIREATRRFIADEVKRLQPSRVYLTLLEREIVGKIRENSVEEIVEESKKIRRELWKKRRKSS